MAASSGRKNDGVVWRPGDCPFCGQPIELFDPTIRCPACDRFHHRWCWTYNGEHCAMLCDGMTRDLSRWQPGL